MSDNSRSEYNVTLFTPPMSMVTRVVLDPELRHTSSGKAVTNIRVVTTRSWYDQQAQGWKNNDAFFSLVLWEAKAEKAIQSGIKKGDILMVVFHPSNIGSEGWKDRQTGAVNTRVNIRPDTIFRLATKVNGSTGPGDYDGSEGFAPGNDAEPELIAEGAGEPEPEGTFSWGV